MIRTAKTTLGLSLMALLAFSGISALSASATTSGHFVSGSTNTKLHLTGATGSSHDASLSVYGSTISCHKTTYSANHFAVATTQEITMSAAFENCTTGSGGTTTVRMNGCHFALKSRAAGTGHATVHLLCPVGKKAELETSSGLMKFGAQTPTGGATFTNLADGTVTASITAENIAAECHGACQLLGTTTTTGKLTGSLTAEGTNTVTGVKTTIQAT